MSIPEKIIKEIDMQSGQERQKVLEKIEEKIDIITVQFWIKQLEKVKHLLE